MSQQTDVMMSSTQQAHGKSRKSLRKAARKRADVVSGKDTLLIRRFCKYHKRGNCKEGDKCAYSHETAFERRSAFKNVANIDEVIEEVVEPVVTAPVVSEAIEEIVNFSSSAFVKWIKEEAKVPRASPWYEMSDDECEEQLDKGSINGPTEAEVGEHVIPEAMQEIMNVSTSNAFIEWIKDEAKVPRSSSWYEMSDSEDKKMLVIADVCLQTAPEAPKAARQREAPLNVVGTISLTANDEKRLPDEKSGCRMTGVDVQAMARFVVV